MTSTTKYFVQNGTKIEGPYVLHDVLNLPLTRETLIWKEGTQSWSRLSEFEEFSSILTKVPPPLVIDFEGKKTIVEESVLTREKEVVHHSRANRYFIYSDSKTTGPFSSEQIREMNLAGDVLLWKDGMKTWEKKTEFKEFQANTHTPPPVPANNTANEIVKETAKETVVHHRRPSGLFYIILFLCILFLLWFFCCHLKSCCCHDHYYGADTTANDSGVNRNNAIITPDTLKQANKNNEADSTARVIADKHQHYLNEIAEQINNFYQVNSKDYTPFNAANSEVSGDPKYAAYLNNISNELKELYIKNITSGNDSSYHYSNDDSAAYFKYINYIQHEADHYFTANVNAVNDSDNMYDRAYLLSIEQLLQKLNTDKPHHHHHGHHDPDDVVIHHHSKSFVVINNFPDYYKYPEIFLGHSSQDIYNANGDKYTTDDDLQNNTYTITYYSSLYEKNYVIDKESDKCVKFTIKFYLGNYYTWYLEKLFPGSTPSNTHRHWTSTYEGRSIEIDLKTIGAHCTPVLVYYFTDTETNTIQND